MASGKGCYDGELSIEVGGTSYSVKVRAECDWCYEKGRMWMPNGDPGYPDEDDLEVTSVDASWRDDNGRDVPADEVTDEMKAALENELYSLSDDDWGISYEDNSRDMYDEDYDKYD